MLFASPWRYFFLRARRRKAPERVPEHFFRLVRVRGISPQRHAFANARVPRVQHPCGCVPVAAQFGRVETSAKGNLFIA